ncbi:MAG TPA: AmmeMemoRadiSam system protein A [Anaeromyxobacter sp.]|nr:AmmeMemoRadiSam system protein A [Anaeromyxobacter sp.]
MTPLTATERAALLGIARAAILTRVAGSPPREVTLPAQGALAEARGAFVSVQVGGELRGCVGTFEAREPLARIVARMAVAAATEDPRFPPVEAADVSRLSVSVSALGPLRPLPDPLSVRVGEDGLLIRRGWHRGALLPKVAVEHGWTAAEFLKHVCLKAGLPARAWQEPGAELQAFHAEEFSEEPEP